MQCLNASRELVYKYVMPKSDVFPYSDMPNSMNQLLRNFFMDIRRVSSTYNPFQVFQGVCSRNSRFKGYQQHDAHDLLINLLDIMIIESDKLSKRTKEEKLKGLKRSIVEEVFGGYYLNTGNLYLTLMPYSTLS